MPLTAHALCWTAAACALAASVASWVVAGCVGVPTRVPILLVTVAFVVAAVGGVTCLPSVGRTASDDPVCLAAAVTNLALATLLLPLVVLMGGLRVVGSTVWFTLTAPKPPKDASGLGAPLAQAASGTVTASTTPAPPHLGTTLLPYHTSYTHPFTVDALPEEVLVRAYGPAAVAAGAAIGMCAAPGRCKGRWARDLALDLAALVAAVQGQGGGNGSGGGGGSGSGGGGSGSYGVGGGGGDGGGGGGAAAAAAVAFADDGAPASAAPPHPEAPGHTNPEAPPPPLLSGPRAASTAAAAVTLVTLMEDRDLAYNGTPHLLAAARASGLRTAHHPIRDKWVPGAHGAVVHALQQLHAWVAGGGSLVVHCNGGKGRTGLVVCLLLCTAPLGALAPSEAVAAVRRARPGTYVFAPPPPTHTQ
jgi:uncharacterized membrane protein YgcG